MSNITEVKKEVSKFLKDNITCYDLTIIKIEKTQDTWNSVAEVYENDSFLKSMNLPPKQMRVYYSVKMDEKLNITSFERLSEYDGTDHAG
jgi:hypothetical protein